MRQNKHTESQIQATKALNELTQIIPILEKLAQLNKSELFAVFEKAVLAKVSQMTPKVTSFTADESIAIASKMAYCQGLTDSLEIVSGADKRLKSLLETKTSKQAHLAKFEN